MRRLSEGQKKVAEKTLFLLRLYPEAVTVQDLIEVAYKEGHFVDEVDMLSIWGRVCRFLPQRAVS